MLINLFPLGNGKHNPNKNFCYITKNLEGLKINMQ